MKDATMYKLALLSFWHVHAKDYARDAERHPETEIVAAWDELPERGAKLAAERGWRFHPSLTELLGDTEIDGVIVTAPTNIHREVMVAAAQAGKHIFTEKVLAGSTADAEAIVTAAQLAGIRLIVSLPRLYHGYTRAISELLAAGELGEPTQLRVRLAHDGALRSDTNPDGWLPLHFY